jgi:phenylalanyl-tRNA synthetase beta chain
MQFSEHWLRSMVDPELGIVELNELLTMSGLEVESCEPVAPPFSGVVVGEVIALDKHPNADRLKVAQVDAGKGAPLNVVCGAPNVALGMKAPVALVGARLPGESPDRPFEIKIASMRGVESQGMLCSARELGLSQDHSGLLALDPRAAVGASVRDVLGLDDHVLLIKLTPNRADCLSVLGVAREVAALTGAPLAMPAIPAIPATIADTFPVKITDANGCGRFAARVIRNVNAKAPTPEWMKRRLERAGQRSIAALVDVTNYVMLELGRPLHVYDLDKLQGGIDVRFGRKGETLGLLNEQTVGLEPDVLAICDARGPIGLGGIMGGESTKADDATRHVFLESAFFFPEAIAGRARRYNFSSDASHRFERGVDFGNNLAGIERATQLILEICGGEPGPTTDTVARLPTREPVRMRVARAQKVIGVPIPADEMASIFSRLGLSGRRESSGKDEAFVVTPPSYRFDILIEEDLIEEIARVHGFNNLPALPPRARAAMSHESEERRSLHDLRDLLATAEYQEVVNFSFVDAQWEADFAANAEPIKVLNPIASQLAVMRSSLIGSLIANIQYNVNRQHERVRVFEVGRVFHRATGLPDGPLQVAGVLQPTRIAGAAFGLALEEQWGTPKRPVEFFDVKADIAPLFGALPVRYVTASHPAMHPGRCARIELEGATVGWLGELHPRWVQKYELARPPVVFELDAAPLLRHPIPRFEDVSKFPAVVRDQAYLVAEGVAAQAMLDAIAGAGIGIVRSVRVFDFYRGEKLAKGKKSLAFRIVMQDTERTLTDPEVDTALAKIGADLSARFQAELRT